MRKICTLFNYILKKLHEEKGSTILVLLIFLMVLSILGTTILFLTLSNYKIQTVDVEIKKDFYSAEAGIEEAYALIEVKIKEAIDHSNQTVEENLDNGVDKNYYTIYTHDEKGDVIGEEIDEEKLKEKMEEWFRQGYKEYLLSNLKTDLEAADAFAANGLFENRISIEVENINPFELEDKYFLRVTSIFEPKKGAERTVSRKFSISIPQYNQPYYEEAYYYNFNNLGIEGFKENAVTAQGDIYVEDGDVAVTDGNIFAFGGESAIDGEREGVIVDSGNLTLHQGNLITRKFLRAIGTNSEIDINGDVYCNTLIVDSDANNANIEVGSEGNDRNQKFRVFTEDDIELNGINSSIEIYGSYYGFSVGISNSLALTHDQSSAIVINSPDIGITSKLHITGEESNQDIEGNPVGIILGGTAYIDFSETQRYQTGESVSINGNYVAYTPLTVPLVLNDVNSSLGISIDIQDSSDYGTYTYNADDGNTIDIELVDTYNNGSERLTAKIKGEILAQSEVNPGAFDVLVGWNEDLDTGVKLENVLYSTGAYITEGDVHNNKKAYLAYSDKINQLSSEYSQKTKEIRISEAYNYPGQNLVQFNSSSKEILYISNSSAGDVALIGDKGTKPSGVSNTYKVGDEINGIIITKGDVYITGEVYFQGIIAAGGDIHFLDDRQKTIRLNKNIEIKSSSTAVGIDEGLTNYIDCSTLIETSGWERN